MELIFARMEINQHLPREAMWWSGNEANRYNHVLREMKND